MDIQQTIQAEFHLKEEQARQVLELIEQGNTIPFIARYRKEMTGSLDDQVLRELNDRLNYLKGLRKRAEEIRSAVEGQGKWNPELAAAVEGARTLAELEDIYRPYKQKRRTRASVARERGLEPLAAVLLEQKRSVDPLALAAGYIDAQKEIATAEEALQGAMDILAEEVSDRADLRKALRSLFYRTGKLQVKAAEGQADTVYSMYYRYEEPVNRIAGHRILAIDRGEREDVLRVSLAVDEAAALQRIYSELIRGDSESSRYVRMACEDGYRRLLFPSLEREIRSMLAERAANQAIQVFSANLRQLLMQPPVKGCVTLGLDPAYRTGCKIAVVDGTGKVLDTAVVYPTPPQNKIEEAERKLCALIQTHQVRVIAIGNGTASRESEAFVARMIQKNRLDVSYMIVSEAGASVYSASKLAAGEFPQFDVSLRSAVSIARRLQDPLAELVKIDPKAIGVGQYQHDMPRARLDEALGGVVEDCVNRVGVDLNTASVSLLSHVAGISEAVARNIVLYREENGAFQNRKELRKVKKLGPKAFEQCAGFLRVSGGDNPLDNTGVHPESYPAAGALLQLCGYTARDIPAGGLGGIQKRAEEMGIPNLCRELGAGEPTVRDMLAELARPGRDPRDELPKPLLRSDVLELKDLKPGMELKGTVRNIVDFGAFVDIGVHEDGLVHISRICDRYIRHPLEVLKVGDIVTVWVLDVDTARKRISLTMKRPAEDGNREGNPKEQRSADGIRE